MIVCRFNHRCSMMVEGDRFRIMGSNGFGAAVDESGRWMQSIGDFPRGAVNLREGVVHVWCDGGAVYEFNADDGPLRIFKLT